MKRRIGLPRVFIFNCETVSIPRVHKFSTFPGFAWDLHSLSADPLADSIFVFNKIIHDLPLSHLPKPKDLHPNLPSSVPFLQLSQYKQKLIESSWVGGTSRIVNIDLGQRPIKIGRIPKMIPLQGLKTCRAA